MGVDKNYCCSSYLAFRYIEDESKNFYEGLKHRHKKLLSDDKRVPVNNIEDMDRVIQDVFDNNKDETLGLLLSGGMDSAIMASYMRGCHAYTFRFMNGNYQEAELKRAEYYADYYGLKLHYVDFEWEDIEKYLPIILRTKSAPVHSIEPQVYKAAIMAKADGVSKIVTGVGADLTYGGSDKLLSKDWAFEEFVKAYMFTDPQKVLVQSEDVGYVFERYRIGDKIDFLGFLNEIYSTEVDSSFMNAFESARMPYIEPYVYTKMDQPLDLQRIRSGDSKYMVRELFRMKYPGMEAPDKIPMPRLVDFWFADWEGPKRKEFKQDLNMDEFTGNQKWQMYCLEQFLNMHEPLE